MYTNQGQDIKEKTKPVRELTDLNAKLFANINSGKIDTLNHEDSLKLFVYYNRSIYYRNLIDQNENHGRFDKKNIENYIKLMQKAISLDTDYYYVSYTYLLDGYFIPITYYYNHNQYDSLVIWNYMILKDNNLPKLDWVYQNDVSFRILNGDSVGVDTAINNWPSELRDGVAYILSNELEKICFNKNNQNRKMDSIDNSTQNDINVIRQYYWRNNNRRNFSSNNYRRNYSSNKYRRNDSRNDYSFRCITDMISVVEKLLDLQAKARIKIDDETKTNLNDFLVYLKDPYSSNYQFYKNE